ncbi:MAG: glycosyltransferase family 4 protein [Pseudomonadota bacterium]|nr:glycosyltransferase family 4 protein [Pseudomonadota bacterium]
MPQTIHVWAPAFSSFGGGITAFSRELAIALQRQGHRLLLCGRNDRQGEWQGMRVRGAGLIPGAGRKFAFATMLLARVARERPALVICTHPNFAPVARLARLLLGVPYAVVAHGIDVHPALSAAGIRALRDAAGVWAVSRWTRERCLAVGVAPDRLRVVGNTVDDDRFSVAEPGADLRQQYGLADTDRILLTVARLDPDEQYKGCENVMRALATTKAGDQAVRYLIAGSGRDRPRLERLAVSLGVADRVTFCGFVADADLPDHYRLADVFVMPSRGEGFGIVFLEAMACGTPAVGGGVDGTRDALDDGALGLLVDPDNPQAIAYALVRLLQGEGPAAWFDPRQLRDACLSRHGREVFSRRVGQAIESALEAA